VFDLKKVKWATGEIILLEKVVNFIDAVRAEQDDEDPHEIDFDDFVNIVRKSGGHLVYAIRHFMALGSARAMLDEATDLLAMVKRYYGLLEDKNPKMRTARQKVKT